MEKILARQEYCGDVINFKTYSKSFKNKARLENAPENWVIFKNVHEPIIDRETFEQVQKLTGNTKRRAPKQENSGKNLFCDLLYCADCGRKLWYHTNTVNKDIHYFSCSNYAKDYRGSCPTRHYIRADAVEQVVIAELRLLADCFRYDQDRFAALLEQKTDSDRMKEQRLTESELQKAVSRSEKVSQLYEKVYEDNAEGKISDEWFMQLSHKYEVERMGLKTKISDLRQKLNDLDAMQQNKDNFLSAVRKFMEMETLTAPLLRELIDRIEVHETEGTGKNRTQRIVIHYRFVGYIELPEDKLIPPVRAETRQGVAVQYLTRCQTA